MFNAARNRSRKGSMEFNIDLSDIVIPDMCPILKVPFTPPRFTASLDRIDNSRGYVKGNVRIISRLANTMKNSASKEELQQFCISTLNEMGISIGTSSRSTNDSKGEHTVVIG